MSDDIWEARAERDEALALLGKKCDEIDALQTRLEQVERNARLFGVRWAIDQGYIGRDYADDALQAAGSGKC